MTIHAAGRQLLGKTQSAALCRPRSANNPIVAGLDMPVVPGTHGERNCDRSS